MQIIEKFVDQISFHKSMDDIKLEELEKACKKICKVRTRMVAIRMARVLDMFVEETADIQERRPNWIRNRLRCYDEGGLEGHAY